MTRTDFVKAYMNEMKARYEWVDNQIKFADFMRGVVLSINADNDRWLCEGEACAAAWKSIGGKGKPTIEKIRALPVA